MNVDLIAIENEKKANRYLMIANFVFFGILLLASAYTLVDYIELPDYIITCVTAYLFGAIVVVVAVILNLKLPEKYFHMKKYFLSISILVIMGCFNLVYVQTLLIFPPIALGVFSRYYDRKFMIKMIFLTGGLMLLYTFGALATGMVVDLNVIKFPKGTTIQIPEYSNWIIDALPYTGITREEIMVAYAINVLPPFMIMYAALCLAFLSLSKSGNEIIEKRTEAARKAAIVDRDLSTAMNIQTSFLSTAFAPFEEKNNIEVFASMGAARQVGGDFYDFCNINDDKVCIVMGDVSGKGIPAALFMVKSQACLHELAYKGLNPAEILTQANNILNDHNNENFYVTIWLGIYDKTTGVLEYANAGHVPPFISRGGEDYEELNCEINFVCGMMPGMEYVLESTSLSSGDRIFTCTDGVTDCANIERKFFGIERLHELLNDCKDKNCKETVDTVVGALSDFQGEAEQFDDITMMMVRVK